MEGQWSHTDIFPIISRAIDALHATSRDFVEHDAIVEFLLKDSEAANRIAAAMDDSEPNRTREWVAHNMVAWFSQRITVGESDWASTYERQKRHGKWAYRPLASDNHST